VEASHSANDGGIVTEGAIAMISLKSVNRRSM